MGVLDELKRLSAAEDFFRYLGVEYEPRVVDVSRLHILKRMGQYLSAETGKDGEDALRERCAGHLKAAYAELMASSPIEVRLFKVHKDAVEAQPQHDTPLVTLQPLRRH